MAPLGGRIFAQRFQQAALARAALRGAQAEVSVMSATRASIPGRIVRNPALISPVDPYGQFRTMRAVPPSQFYPRGGASTPVRDPRLISPVDPYGQFRTMRAVAPSEATPRGGPSTPVRDPSLISPVDPYGEFRLN